MKKTFVLALIAAFVFISATRALAAQYPSKISGIFAKGNIAVSSEAIIRAVQSRAGDVLDQDKLNADMKSVYSLGCFSDVKTDLKASTKGTAVTFVVKENPVVKNIAVTGNTVYATGEILSVLSSESGRVMSFANIQHDLQAIDDKYHKDGYVLEKVVDISTDPSTGVMKIKVVEGSIDSIELDGNNATRDYVILRELKSKPGTVVNENILSKDMHRLFNLGFFSEVNPDFEPATSPDKVILVIKIKENKTNTVNFGGGYGESEGWFGFIDLSADNLVGTGQGLMLRGQSGQAQQTYQLRYMYPWLMPDKLGDRVSFTFRRWLTVGKNIYLLDPAQNQGIYNGWDTTFSKPLTDEWNASVTIGSEQATPNGTSTFEPYLADTIGLSLSYDTRDNWMNPSTGKYYTFGLTRGWKFATMTTNFTKDLVDLNQYIKVVDKLTLAVHAGTGVGMGDIPIGEIFYVGGANTVRGYEPTEAKIGTKKLLANIELRYTFNDMLQGVIFYDWGNAWYGGGPNLNDFISGKGFGVRLNTPMGPIRLDYGIGANRAFAEGVLHFSIGQAF